ncbi:MAG TPA: hypothetical protein PKE27_10160 [Povalibacter sp.]|uniref:hypothetical protein n=1 Tax=Povalibacter sp. TaxID=1962978 RepID=UPI002B5986E5|nr:hypothetical protein [Povalibacter sp.]HMN44928.1 hypothetical protein [Povalibacter sp.]
MNRRLLKLLSLWIVPLLIARAMIPAGYMLSTADGLQLMFCPSVVQAPAMAGPSHAGHMDHSAHAGHDMSQHAGHHGSAPAGDTSHENSACPFSLVATAALLDIPYVAPTSIRPVDESIEFTSVPAAGTALQHLDRIRGPPRFS